MELNLDSYLREVMEDDPDMDIGEARRCLRGSYVRHQSAAWRAAWALDDFLRAVEDFRLRLRAGSPKIFRYFHTRAFAPRANLYGALQVGRPHAASDQTGTTQSLYWARDHAELSADEFKTAEWILCGQENMLAAANRLATVLTDVLREDDE